MDNIYIIKTSSSVNYQEIDFNSNVSVILNPYDLIKGKISNFAALPNNWDGYGGITPLESICEKALTFVHMLNSTYIDYITDIFPNPNGTLTIDWENFKNEKISLEIGENNFSFFVKYIDKEPKFINGEEDIIQGFKTLTEELGELFGENIFNFIP